MRTVSLLSKVFLGVGVGTLAGALYWYDKTSSFLEQATTAEGIVVDLVRARSNKSSTYRPVVQFSDQRGETIEIVSSTGSNPPSYTKGEKVTVYYLPAAPQGAKIDRFFSLWGGATIMAGLGTVFFLVGAGMIGVPMLKARRDDYLRRQGSPIETEYQGVELNTALRVNGRHPFRVVTHWHNPATAEVHVFRSSDLWFDPSSYMTRERITVFIEKNNPKNYYVDLSFLPKLAE